MPRASAGGVAGAVRVPAGALARGWGRRRWRVARRHDVSVGPACCATAWLARSRV